jgi:hypothetical protein
VVGLGGGPGLVATPLMGAAAGALGRIQVGMSLNGGKPEVHPLVEKGWLRSELERAGIPSPPANGT